MSIDWETNRIAFNRDHHTNYTSHKVFIGQIYKKYKTLQKCGEVLCVSHAVFHREMVKLGIPRGAKGHRFPSPAQAAVLKMDTKDKYRWQIAQEAGITLQHAWILLTRFNKEWRKLRN